MKNPISPSLRIQSLRRFILVWSGAIGIAFLLLALDAVLTLRHLDEAAHDEMNHAQRLQLVQNFEVAALEANRRPDASWKRADGALRVLQNAVAPADIAPIAMAYRALRTDFAAPTPWNDERPFLECVARVSSR